MCVCLPCDVIYWSFSVESSSAPHSLTRSPNTILPYCTDLCVLTWSRILWNEDQKAKREHLTEIFYPNKRMPCSVFPFRYGCFRPCAVHRVWIFGSVILSALQHGAVSMYLCSNLYIGFGRLWMWLYGLPLFVCVCVRVYTRKFRNMRIKRQAAMQFSFAMIFLSIFSRLFTYSVRVGMQQHQ